MLQNQLSLNYDSQNPSNLQSQIHESFFPTVQPENISNKVQYNNQAFHSLMLETTVVFSEEITKTYFFKKFQPALNISEEERAIGLMDHVLEC